MIEYTSEGDALLPIRAFRPLGGRMPVYGLLGKIFGGGNDAPDPPDYAGAALAQGQMSKENLAQQTWANRPTQITAWGRTDYGTEAGIDPGTGAPITKWTQTETLTPELQAALNSQIALQRGRSELGQGFMGRVEEAYKKPFSYAGMPARAETPEAGGLQAQDLQDRIRQYGQKRGVQNYALDKSAPTQTTRTTNAPAFADQREQYTQAAMDYMRPEWERSEAATRTMLANQGLTPGSEAYNTELERLSRNQQADKWKAIEQGGAEQQRMNQLLMQQQQQAFGQDVAGQQAQNQARGQQFQQGLASGQFTNQALQNLFGQGLGAGQFYNQAAGQRFGQEQAAGAQNFQQQLAAANFQNQNRQQAIAEEAQRRGMSLNEMNALLTGQQVQNPQMPQFSQAGAAQAAPMLQAAGMQGQFDLGAQQMQNQGTKDLWGGLGNLAMAGAQFYSDRRLKRDIKKLYDDARGFAWYVFRYVWSTDFTVGVMADEVPHAAILMPNGYFAVDYSKL